MVQTKLSSYLFALFCAFLFILPIPLGANRPWAWSLMEVFIFLICIGCAYLNKDKKGLGLIPFTSMLFLWGFFTVFAVLQIIPLPPELVKVLSPNSYNLYALANTETFYLSIDRGQSLISLIKTFAYTGVLLCTLILVNSEKRIKLLLTVMLAAGTFQALYGSLEILSGMQNSIVFGLDVSKVATGSFVYKNHYANFLLMCLAAGIGLIVTSLQKDQNNSPKEWMRSLANTLLGNKALIRISLAIMVIGLVMSRSRMGNTAFFVAMTMVGLIALVLIQKRSRGLTVLIISMFVIDLFIVSAYFGLEKVQERLTETSLQQESRDEIVSDALPIVMDFPLMGSGAGTFYSIFPKYKKANVHSFYDHAHNDYLQMLIEHGLLATLTLGTMVAFAFYKALRAMRRRKNSIFKGASFACAMVILGMMIHIAVDFPLQAFANTSYFVVFIGLAMVINSLKIRRKPSNRGASKRNIA